MKKIFLSICLVLSANAFNISGVLSGAGDNLLGNLKDLSSSSLSNIFKTAGSPLDFFETCQNDLIDSVTNEVAKEITNRIGSANFCALINNSLANGGNLTCGGKNQQLTIDAEIKEFCKNYESALNNTSGDIKDSVNNSARSIAKWAKEENSKPYNDTRDNLKEVEKTAQDKLDEIFSGKNKEEIKRAGLDSKGEDSIFKMASEKNSKSPLLSVLSNMDTQFLAKMYLDYFSETANIEALQKDIANAKKNNGKYELDKKQSAKLDSAELRNLTKLSFPANIEYTLNDKGEITHIGGQPVGVVTNRLSLKVKSAKTEEQKNISSETNTRINGYIDNMININDALIKHLKNSCLNPLFEGFNFKGCSTTISSADELYNIFKNLKLVPLSKSYERIAGLEVPNGYFDEKNNSYKNTNSVNLEKENIIKLDKLKPTETNIIKLDKLKPTETNIIKLDKLKPTETNIIKLDKLKPTETNIIKLDKLKPTETNIIKSESGSNHSDTTITTNNKGYTNNNIYTNKTPNQNNSSVVKNNNPTILSSDYYEMTSIGKAYYEALGIFDNGSEDKASYEPTANVDKNLQELKSITSTAEKINYVKTYITEYRYKISDLKTSINNSLGIFLSKKNYIKTNLESLEKQLIRDCSMSCRLVRTDEQCYISKQNPNVNHTIVSEGCYICDNPPTKGATNGTCQTLKKDILNYESLLTKIDYNIQDLETRTSELSNILQRLTDINYQIDTEIKKFNYNIDKSGDGVYSAYNFLSKFYEDENRFRDKAREYAVKNQELNNKNSIAEGVSLFDINQADIIEAKAPKTFNEYKKGVKDISQAIQMDSISSGSSANKIISSIPTKSYKSTDANSVKQVGKEVSEKVDILNKNIEATANIKKGLLKDYATTSKDIAVPTKDYIEKFVPKSQMAILRQIQKQQMREALIEARVDEEARIKKETVKILANKALILKEEFDEEASYKALKERIEQVR
ncbi:hypothetical protein [Campylobacter sp. RM12651]|uniref:hypothetical protein n=1 Tax=Campylobacter sp. RM12651 TaxID=1660079 RepID=UPI001EFBEB7C|nr:hypothetical protein [Campylobacter sp. RM12651]ULO04490.1 hypothetical protein AVBRAN_a0008 [Campylobacter sp. RM12651]